jgi:surface antigen
MRFRAILALALVGALLGAVAPAAPAEASTRVLCTGYDSCARKGYDDHGYKERRFNLFWRMAGDHNCTNYVAYLLNKRGMPNVRPWVGDGNAYAWGDFTKGYRDGTPVVGAVAWWAANRAPASSSGHVSYVEKVISANEIIVSEDNWKGEFRWKRITKSGGGWPSSFIHFKDSRTPKPPALSATQLSQSVWTDKSRTTAVTSAGLAPGSTAWVELQYQNTGGTTWKGVRLGTQAPADRVSELASGWPAPTRAAKQSPASVARGKTATFGFAVKVPADATPGTTWTERFAPVTAKGTWMTQSDVWVQFTVGEGVDFTSRPKPTISGTIREGEVVTAVPGQWSPAATLSYSWKRNGVAIPRATAQTYTLVTADVGTRLTVSVTATGEGLLPSTQTSAQVPRVGSIFSDRLALGDRLAVGEQIVSVNGVYTAIQRTEGTLTIYDRRTMTPLWTSVKTGTGYTTRLAGSGSLVVSSKSGATVWSSKTSGRKVSRAVITNSGTLALYTASGKVIWSSRTSGR